MPDILIDHIKQSEIPAVVALHKAAFPNSFLTRLGVKFLTMYYRAVIDDNRGVIFLAKDCSDNPVGFVALVFDPINFYDYLNSQKRQFAFSAVRAIFTDINVIIGMIFRVLALRTRSARRTIYGHEIVSIGVDIKLKRAGVGSSLLKYIDQFIGNAGGFGVYLRTDSIKNDDVISFYKKNGYEIFQSERTGTRLMHILFKNIPAL